MRPIFTLLLAAALAASAADARRAVDPRRGPQPIAVPADCPLVIGFSSYAAGIDRATFDRALALLNRDRSVRAVTRHNWGREGEVTLCAQTRTPADAARLFRAIRAFVPARPRGPVFLSTRSGLRFEAPGRTPRK